jgi:hypothetical protein
MGLRARDRVLRETEAIPAELEPQIRDAEEFAGLPPGAFVEVLVNRYPPGAGIGWHNDADVYKTIIGISLGSSQPECGVVTQPIGHLHGPLPVRLRRSGRDAASGD